VSGPPDGLDLLLGELGPEERARAEARLREDPELRAEVERLRPVVGHLRALPAAAWTPGPPPPLAHPAPPARPRHAVRRGLAIAAAACALLGAGVGIGLLAGGGGDGGAGPEVALRPLGAQDPAAGGVARVVGGPDGRLRLDVHGLHPLGARGFYELWLIRGTRLVALASFRVGASGRASVEAPLGVDPHAYGVIDISAEPADGNPGHSGDSVLRGPTRRL
jgi:hypothetical protein